jgi:hypothetical protein
MRTKGYYISRIKSINQDIKDFFEWIINNHCVPDEKPLDLSKQHYVYNLTCTLYIPKGIPRGSVLTQAVDILKRKTEECGYGVDILKSRYHKYSRNDQISYYVDLSSICDEESSLQYLEENYEELLDSFEYFSEYKIFIGDNIIHIGNYKTQKVDKTNVKHK